MALGARRGEVLRMIVIQGLAMAAVGLTFGLAAALMVSRLFGHLLFEVRPSDPLSYASVIVLLAGVAALASYLPARRAVRVDPVTALRCE